MSYDLLLAYVNRCYEDFGYIPSESEIDDQLGWTLTFADYEQFEQYLPNFIAINDMTGIDIHYKGVEQSERIKYCN